MSSITIDIENVSDENAYKTLFSKHSKLIFKLINDFVKSHNMHLHSSEIDDIYQEVALKIFKNDYIAKYNDGKCSFITWLNIICRTTAIDYYRKNLRWMEFVLEDEEHCDETAVVPPPFSLPAEVLTQRQAEIITLLFKDGFSTDETAERLGITTRTVRSLKFQALNRLREHYGATTHRADRPEDSEHRRSAS